MCGYADVATGKMRIKTADVKCGCVGKMRMCGCDFTLNLSTLHPPYSRPTPRPTAAPCHGLITSNYPALSVTVLGSRDTTRYAPGTQAHTFDLADTRPTLVF